MGLRATFTGKDCATGGRGVHMKRSVVVKARLESEYHRGVAVSRILVVDDEQRICRFVARALEANGFQFHVAANGFGR